MAERTTDQALEGHERSLATDIAAVATPAAIVAAPIVNAWAKQHFGDGEKSNEPPPQQADPED
jgi:hypothetical protein